MSFQKSLQYPAQLSPPESPGNPSLDASRENPGAQIPASPPHSISLTTSPAYLASMTPMSLSAAPSQDIVSSDVVPPRTSSKHRLPDDEIDDEPKKRQRTDHDRIETKYESDLCPTGVVYGGVLKLSNKPYLRSRPHPSQDLTYLYGLGELAASVARRDPTSGEKINVLRKSYKGKIKNFPGKNETIISSDHFLGLLSVPEEEWNIQRVTGNEMERALSVDQQSLSNDFLKRLENAVAMAPGPLPPPEREKWRSILDISLPAPKPKSAEFQPVHANHGKATVGDGVRRPKRKGAVRSYSDNAFEGYREDAPDDGSDIGDDRSSVSGTTTKRRVRPSIDETVILLPKLVLSSPTKPTKGGRKTKR